MKKGLLLVVCLTLIFSFFPSAEVKGQVTPPDFNVLIIGWDAVQWNHLQEMLAAGQLPNLAKLNVFKNITTSGATSTKAGWSQILSGYSSETTGIYSNDKYQPLKRWATIFEKAENYFGDENLTTIFVAGKCANVGGLCSGENGEVLGQPYCRTKNYLDLWRNCVGANQKVGKQTLNLLEKYASDPFLAFFHFREPDRIGHEFGENSSQYSAAIVDDDVWLGKILGKLEELGLAEKTLVYVVSDHGYDEGLKRHRHAPEAFLATNDPQVTREGNRMDVAATILARYGISLGPFKKLPAVDGQPLW